MPKAGQVTMKVINHLVDEVMDGSKFDVFLEL